MHDICRDTSVVQFEGILSNDNKYWEKLISIDKEVGTCICKKEKNKKSHAENLTHEFQFPCFSKKIQYILLIGKAWIYRFFQKILILTL